MRDGAHIVLGIQVGALGDEVLEAVELALGSRLHEGRLAVLRRRGGGVTRGVSGGAEGRAARVADSERVEGEDGGGCGSGWRGGAHPFCGFEVHPLLHKAGEGGKLTLPRRVAKSLLRLRA